MKELIIKRVLNKITRIKTRNILLALTTLLVLILCLPAKASAATSDGLFYLSPSTGSFIQACESRVHIYVDTGSNISTAANVIVSFDPSQIEIIDSDPTLAGTQISSGNAYDLYADNIVDTAAGRIRLTGIVYDEGFSGIGRFGTIVFRSQPEATSADLSIVFTGVGDTLDSNIADKATSDDVLGSVGNGTYSFVEGDCIEDTTPPTIEPISPQNYEEDVSPYSNVIVKICDDQSGVDIGSVVININGGVYTSVDANYFSYQLSGACYTVTIDPRDPFPANSAVYVVIEAYDFSANFATESIVFNRPFEDTDCGQRISEEFERFKLCEDSFEECREDLRESQDVLLEEMRSVSKGLLYLPLTGTAQLSLRVTLNITSIILALLSLFFAYPSLFIKREKRPWGIVYDRKTRKSIAFATVRIYSDGKLKDQKVTDLEGRYGFLVEDGRYEVTVGHGNYEKKSVEYTLSQDEPGIYLDIPLTPLVKKRIAFGYKIREQLANAREVFKRLASYTFSVGLIVSLVALLERPTIFNQVILVVYLLAGIIYALISWQRKAGRVISTVNQKGIAYGSVRIFSSEKRKLIDTQMTDSKGRYSFIVDPGKYLLHASMPGYSFPSEEQYEDVKRVFFGSVVEMDIRKKKTLSIDLFMDPITQGKFQNIQEEAQKAAKKQHEPPQKQAQLRSPFSGESVLP